MKRTLSCLLTLSLLLSLTACGGGTSSSASAETATSVSEAAEVQTDSDGYIVPASWTENSVNDGVWGYITSEAEVGDSALPEDCTEDNGHYYTKDQDTMELVFYQEDGSEICTICVPSKLEGADGEDQNEYLSYICPGETCVWLVQNCFVILDEDTGEITESYYLEQWDYNGQQLLSIPLDTDFGLTGDDFICGLALSDDDTPLLISMNELWFLDSTGAITGTADTGGVWYSTCRDRDGRLYLIDDGTMVYTVDWENCALGEELLSLTYDDSIQAGSGDYDFFLISSSTLRGVTLSAGTITEILSWDDVGLSGGASTVTCLDEETFLVGYYSSLTRADISLLLQRVPAEEIPERQTVTMAAPMSESATSWTDEADSQIADAVTLFNLTSETYQIEVVTYSSATDLQTMMLAGDAPDLIFWNDSSYLEDAPNAYTYARRGYLADLEALIEADDDLSPDDFVPSVISLTENAYGGLYVMPTAFYMRTLSGLTEYVGTEPGWSFQDLLETAEQLPDDVVLCDGFSQLNFLSYIMETLVAEFVDASAGTCSFETQEFYDLLTLCRDYFPEETENTGETSLLATEAVIGRIGQFATDVVAELDSQGRTLIGYPGASGSGANLIMRNQFSICTLGDQQEAAWDFLKTLLSYDTQSNLSGVFSSVRLDALEATELTYREMYEDCTDELYQEALDLILNAGCTTVYDSPISAIVLEEAEAFFAGDKTAEEAAALIQNRAEIYLAEQS